MLRYTELEDWSMTMTEGVQCLKKKADNLMVTSSEKTVSNTNYVMTGNHDYIENIQFIFHFLCSLTELHYLLFSYLINVAITLCEMSLLQRFPDSFNHTRVIPLRAPTVTWSLLRL